MKTIIHLLVIFLAFSAAGCKKDKTPPPPVEGTWEIRRSSGELPTTYYNPGNDTLLTFHSNGRYEMFSGSQQGETGSYRIEKGEGKDRLFLTDDWERLPKTFTYSVGNNGNELIVYDGNSTVREVVYQKIR